MTSIKKYIKPVLEIRRFSTENIVTESGLPEQEYLEVFQNYENKAQVSFNSLTQLNK